MSKRVCAEPGCPQLVDAGTRDGRCPLHRRERDRARGTRQQRGYDAAHEARRKQLAPLVATGNVKCWRCRDYIAVGEAWDLGHDDHDRTRYRGAEHSGCNRATASHM